MRRKRRKEKAETLKSRNAESEFQALVLRPISPNPELVASLDNQDALPYIIHTDWSV